MKKVNRALIFAIFLSFILIFAGCSAKKYDPNALQNNTNSEENSSASNAAQGTPITQVTPSAPATPINPATNVSPAPKSKLKYRSASLVSSYTTRILDKSKGRVNNIRIAAEQIDGDIVRPGETFSFNSIVGERTSDEGYRKAKIIVNGKTKLGTGGGVCQVSSTLYNTARKAGMEIVERHTHPKDVYYVPRGMDATVVYGSLDFKFRNNKDYPVRITARVTRSKVNVRIYKIREL